MVESLREREVLYKLIISQLRYDGLDMVAANLAKCVGLETTPLSPSSRLLGIMKLGLQEEKNGMVPEMESAPGLAPVIPPAHGLDLEYETEEPTRVARQETVASCATESITEKPQPGQKRKANDADSITGISGDDDEEDLNARPTLVACKVEFLNKALISRIVDSESAVDTQTEATVEKHESEAGNEKEAEHYGHEFETIDVREVELEGTKDDCADTVESHVEVETGECKFEQRLELLVNFDPRNKGKLTDLARKGSLDYITEIFGECREKFRETSFKDLVSMEVLNFGINQSIFSKAVLGRSQGYLSDLLNHQEAIMSMTEPTRMFANFVKIKQFLELDEPERRLRYTMSVKESHAERKKLENPEHPKISLRKKRVKLQNEVKENLKILFKNVDTMPNTNELLQISREFNLEISTIKNFFRNFKARSKMAEN